jgi:TDG/mug DNA glycosylase family protein
VRLVFVGINPSIYSVQRGHYFARRGNRFWPAFSRSRLSAPIRAALGVEALQAEHDQLLPAFGIGFTDVVKVPSATASTLTPADYAEWSPRLFDRLRDWHPDVACFHGVTGFRPFVKWGLGGDPRAVSLGEQPPAPQLGRTRLYVVPNPSGANAHVKLADQVAWYDRLADFLG